MKTVCMIEFTFKGEAKYVMSVIEKLKKIAREEDSSHKEMVFLFRNYYWEDEDYGEEEDELKELYRLLERSDYYYDSGGSDGSFSPKDFEEGFEKFARRFIEDFVYTFPDCELAGEFSQFTTVCDITEFKYSFYSHKESTEYSIEWIEEEEYGGEKL